MAKMVGPEGPRDARVFIVGEAPGRDEEELGRPFVGAAGRLLNAMLAKAGMKRDECYVTNISYTRPPDNDFGAFYLDRSRNVPSKKLEEDIDRLREEVTRISPFIVLALGAEPLRALTGKRRIGKWRGSLMTVSGTHTKLIATYHPASILRQYSLRAIAELDIKRVREESSTRDLNLPHYELHVQPSLEQVMDYLGSLDGPIGFDIETIGRRVRCVAVARGPRDGLCVPFMSLGGMGGVRPGDTRLLVTEEGAGNYWTEEEERLVLRELKRVLEDPSIPKVLQNFPFDATLIAEEFGIRIDGLWMDTLAAHHVCYPELPKSLDFLCSIYTRTPRYSDHDPGNDMDEWRYNCMDACVCLEVAMRLERECREYGVWRFYKDHVEPTLFAVTRAQNRKIKVDVALRDKERKRLEDSAEAALEGLRKLTGRDINPNSPTQMKRLLYEDLKLPRRVHRKTKKTTTNEKALRSLARTYPACAEIVELVLRYREAIKISSTFLGCELDEGGFLRTSYNISGTVNGRLSSSKTVFGEGINIQQVPRSELRRIIVPREGRLWIKTDLVQAEARVVAWAARIDRLIELFLSDEDFDIHTWNASENVFRIPPEEVTKDQRQIAKAGVHGGNYGLGPRTAAEIYGIAYEEARRALDGYRNALPRLREWWNEIDETITRTRTLKNPFGRQRIFMGRLGPELFRSAYAFIPQSTVVDIINRVFAITDKELPEGAFPLLQVHDEIDFEVPPDKLSESLKVIKRAYDIPLRFEGVAEPLVIPVEISVGKNWWDVERVA